jgi:hypothetical protein
MPVKPQVNPIRGASPGSRFEPGADGEIRTPGQRFTNWRDRCRWGPSGIREDRRRSPGAALLLVSLLVEETLRDTGVYPGRHRLLELGDNLGVTPV